MIQRELEGLAGLCFKARGLERYALLFLSRRFAGD
jgi:hypothetical protein